MRRYVLAVLTTTLLAVLVAADAPAQEVAWSTDVRSAWKTAQSEGRPLIVYVTSSHCPYCRRMASDTLANPDVARRVQASYVPVIVNADDPTGMAAQLRITGVPTTLLVLPDGRIADRMEGYVSAGKLRARLDSVVRQMQDR